MKKLMVTLLGIAVVCSLCFAEGTGSAAPTKTTPSKDTPSKETPSKETTSTSNASPANNVVKMEKEGKQTALCCCLAEFTVTDKAPVMEHGSTSFYLCGDGCKEVAAKATPEENEKTMAAWSKKYETYQFPGNTVVKENKRMATCVCGNEFTVTDSSPIWRENGVTMYLCGLGCAEKMKSMTADERLALEKQWVASAK